MVCMAERNGIIISRFKPASLILGYCQVVGLHPRRGLADQAGVRPHPFQVLLRPKPHDANRLHQGFDGSSPDVSEGIP